MALWIFGGGERSNCAADFFSWRQARNQAAECVWFGGTASLFLQACYSVTRGCDQLLSSLTCCRDNYQPLDEAIQREMQVLVFAPEQWLVSGRQRFVT